jgi:TRAP-type C4-dicarboxylate transport system permease small subunit
MTTFVQFLMGSFAVFMVYYGSKLVETTFFQTYPEFQYIRVGLVYTAIPIAGFVTFLFAIEKLIAPQALASDPAPGVQI